MKVRKQKSSSLNTSKENEIGISLYFDKDLGTLCYKNDEGTVVEIGSDTAAIGAGPGYKVYTHSLTMDRLWHASAADGIDQPGYGPPPNTFFTIGQEYFVSHVLGSDDFSNIGWVSGFAPFVATGTDAARWINNSVVVKMAESVPVVNVFQNTMDNPVTHAYAGRGATDILCADFTTTNVHIDGHGDWAGGNANPYFPIYNGSAIVGWYYILLGTGKITIYVKDNAGNSVDWDTLVGAGGNLSVPDIKVYG